MNALGHETRIRDLNSGLHAILIRPDDARALFDQAPALKALSWLPLEGPPEHWGLSLPQVDESALVNRMKRPERLKRDLRERSETDVSLECRERFETAPGVRTIKSYATDERNIGEIIGEYSAEDVGKVMGGNFFRVWQAASAGIPDEL